MILNTDSYKVAHWRMYPEDTVAIHSYLEAREGAEDNEIVFFGLQSILNGYGFYEIPYQFEIDFAEALCKSHFGDGAYFNRKGWDDVRKLGYLPLRIRAVPEGSVTAPGTVLVTVENTVPGFGWLVNYVETVLSHVWYPSTVATRSRALKAFFAEQLRETVGSTDGVHFMLHDFGCRGVSSIESAAIGGAAHLVNFWGTDTLPALTLLWADYEADLDTTGFSVAASEHSVMTQLGPDGEADVVAHLLDTFPTGILSVVADSYDVYNFVENIVGKQFRDRIAARDGKFVVRPDSDTPRHPNPADQVVWILQSLDSSFGHAVTEKGFKILNHVGVLWGDGIGPDGICEIVLAARDAGYAASNLVFGMGGGLLQKVNRDTERFAFKASARQTPDGVWHPVQKNPLDKSKASKAGRFDDDPTLQVVFENGKSVNSTNFTAIRERAEAGLL